MESANYEIDSKRETRHEAAKKAEEERNEDLMHLCYYNDADDEYEVGKGDKTKCSVCTTKLAKKIRINLSMVKLADLKASYSLDKAKFKTIESKVKVDLLRARGIGTFAKKELFHKFFLKKSLFSTEIIFEP